MKCHHYKNLLPPIQSFLPVKLFFAKNTYIMPLIYLPAADRGETTMNQVKKIQYILSILLTIENHEYVQPDIRCMKRLLRKAVRHKPLSWKEKQRMDELFLKYSQLLRNVITVEENDNKIGRVALLNDLCYNYYKTESMVLLLQNKNLDSCIANIKSINQDIESFNKNYGNRIYVENNEKKYIRQTQKLFGEFETSAAK